MAIPTYQIIDCRAILFDMDGVLCDSTACVERHWRAWAKEHAIADFGGLLELAHGSRTEDTILKVAPHLDTRAEADRLEARAMADTDGIVATPGALQLLRTLPQDRWAVVTSASREMARIRLVAAGISPPPVLIGAEDVSAGKPAPDGYLLAASRLHAAASESIVIEDTPIGIRSGHAAMMRVVALQTTYRPETLADADYCVKDLTDVTARVDREGVLTLSLRRGRARQQAARSRGR
jgi:mannitol-1-/sugar-/sorbitol-6-phosphatase